MTSAFLAVRPQEPHATGEDGSRLQHCASAAQPFPPPRTSGQGLRVFIKPEEQLTAVCKGVAILFRDHGSIAKNAPAPRLKFLVADWGWQKCRDELERIIGFQLEHDDSIAGPVHAPHTDHMGIGPQKRNPACSLRRRARRAWPHHRAADDRRRRFAGSPLDARRRRRPHWPVQQAKPDFHQHPQRQRGRTLGRFLTAARA